MARSEASPALPAIQRLALNEEQVSFPRGGETSPREFRWGAQGNEHQRTPQQRDGFRVMLVHGFCAEGTGQTYLDAVVIFPATTNCGTLAALGLCRKRSSFTVISAGDGTQRGMRM